MSRSTCVALILCVTLSAPPARTALDEEVALFGSSGKTEAYIDFEDEMTIYLWGGKPVAYLEKSTQGGY